MSPDGLKERLREIPAPPAVQARERVVAEARAEIEARGRGERGREKRAARTGWVRERPLLGIAAAVLLVIVVLLTPPGRAASAWVGDLVGIGDVGGPPSQEKQGSFIKRGTAVVIDNGTAPDGSRYEWVGYRCGGGMHEGTGPGFEGIGTALQWPGVKGQEGGGFCEELQGRPSAPNISSHGVHILPSQFKGVAEPGLVIEGTTGPRVHRIRVIYRDPEGEEHNLPVDFARVQGRLRKLASQPQPLGTFIAFLPGDVAARDELLSRLDLRALMGTGKLKLGPIGRREREQAQAAFDKCRPLEPDPANFPPNPSPKVRKEIERAFGPAKECYDRHMPPGPFEYVAYDTDGHVLERTSEGLVPALARPQRAIEAEGHEEPGDRRARRPTSKGSTTATIATGRSPDGALYEAYGERSDYGDCIWTWWPYARGGSWGACGDGLPPSTAFGRREPERVFAKPFGFLNDAAEATRYRILTGFARTNVRRVHVAWRDRRGHRRDAVVRLTQVTAAKLDKLSGSGPFGWWIAFVPRSAGHRPVDVTAYSEDGGRLGDPFTLRHP
jgi:hypothetical protein